MEKIEEISKKYGQEINFVEFLFNMGINEGLAKEETLRCIELSLEHSKEIKLGNIKTEDLKNMMEVA